MLGSSFARFSDVLRCLYVYIWVMTSTLYFKKMMSLARMTPSVRDAPRAPRTPLALRPVVELSKPPYSCCRVHKPMQDLGLHFQFGYIVSLHLSDVVKHPLPRSWVKTTPSLIGDASATIFVLLSMLTASASAFFIIFFFNFSKANCCYWPHFNSTILEVNLWIRALQWNLNNKATIE